ncbi:nuclease [Streptomyces sp. Ru73]|uniref:thermonuclease family protein n=1 Tax=Streptomyces sp. Ru73 TaxID=2080748 RepID=UPI000CDD8870|nr:nuclease [Streptomyces sp. Ru73]POX43420.1 nuclease [Streptomyces sp. Ru73]
MAMLVIEGHYRIVGAGPDGDSVRFQPADPDEWRLVGGRHRVRTNRTGAAQLRLDGIDALETHYTVPHGPQLRQPPVFAEGAAAELLSWLGFTRVTRDARGVVSDAEPAEVAGYVLTRTADKYGRCVALAGRGTPPGPSGREAVVGTDLLARTANHHQLAQGLAYPTYYRLLYAELRDAMTRAVQEARAARRGLWPEDRTRSGARLTAGLKTLTTDVVVLPKLFRRLADYLVLNDGDPALDGFPLFLKQHGDRLFVLSELRYTGLDNVVEITAPDTVRLRYDPEDLVFDEA